MSYYKSREEIVKLRKELDERIEAEGVDTLDLQAETVYLNMCIIGKLVRGAPYTHCGISTAEGMYARALIMREEGKGRAEVANQIMAAASQLEKALFPSELEYL